MAEKCKQCVKNELLSVVVNFESLRFMILIRENYLISDLITEAEKTFAKLCSTKVTIKTLKNSVNAVLPNWYPVVPLIKNGDDIFAFSDGAADVLNAHLTKKTLTDTKSPCSSTVACDSGISSRVEVKTFGKYYQKNSMQRLTNKTKETTELKKIGLVLDKKERHGPSSGEDSEKSLQISQNLSINNEECDTDLKHNQAIREKKVKPKEERECKTSEISEGDTSDDGDSVVEGTKRKKSLSVRKSKKRIVATDNENDDMGGDLTHSVNAEEKKASNESGVFDSGRLSSGDHSKIDKSARKPPDKGTDAKKKPTTVSSKQSESRARTASYSSSDTSDDSSWTTDASSGNTHKDEITPVQKGSGINTLQEKRSDVKAELRGKKTDPVESKTSLNGQMVNSGAVTSKVEKDSSESSEDNEEDMVVDGKAPGITYRNSSGKASENIKQDSASEPNNRNITKKPPAEILTNDSCNEKNKAKELKSKVESDDSSSGGDNENIETPAGNRTKQSSRTSIVGNKAKSSKVVDNESSSVSSDTSLASDKRSTRLSNSKKALNRSKKSDSDSKKHRLKKSEPVARTNLSNSGGKDAPSSESDDDSSWTGSSAISSTKKTSTGDAKDVADRKNGVDDGIATDSDDDANSIKHPVKRFSQVSGKDKSKMDMITAPSDGESNDSASAGTKKPFTQVPAEVNKGHPKDIAEEVASNSDNDSHNSSSTNFKTPFTQIPAKGSARSQNEINNVARDSDDDSDNTACIGTNSVTERNERSSNTQSKKNRQQSPPPNKIVPKSPKTPKTPRRQPEYPKSSARLPQSPVTPRSRKAALDKSKSKVASWLLANHGTENGGGVDGGNTIFGDQAEAVIRGSNAEGHSKDEERQGKGSNQGQFQGRAENPDQMIHEEDIDATTGEARDKVGEETASPKKSEKTQKRKLNESTEHGQGESSPTKNAKKKRKRNRNRKKPFANKNEANTNGIDEEKRDTNEIDTNDAGQTAQPALNPSKRKEATPLTLPKKTKGLLALVEDDDNVGNSQLSKKPKVTPKGSDRRKPKGFLTGSKSVERKSGEAHSGRQKKKFSSSQPVRATELNCKEKELLSSGNLNLELLLNDESITW